MNVGSQTLHRAGVERSTGHGPKKRNQEGVGCSTSSQDEGRKPHDPGGKYSPVEISELLQSPARERQKRHSCCQVIRNLLSQLLPEDRAWDVLQQSEEEACWEEVRVGPGPLEASPGRLWETRSGRCSAEGCAVREHQQTLGDSRKQGGEGVITGAGRGLSAGAEWAKSTSGQRVGIGTAEEPTVVASGWPGGHWTGPEGLWYDLVLETWCT